MIDIRNCVKTYPGDSGRRDVRALDGVSLSVAAHEFVCLLGPSGCGKTTLLKIIAGLLPWDAGEVRVNGAPVAGPGGDRSMVFQDFALLPWADVLDNVAFGLRLRGVPRQERNERARGLISAFGLAGFERHFPAQLSGGMQQRVGLARALATDPQVLLMDEPFGALDALTRRMMQEELLAWHQGARKTVVFVTHSVDEAIRLGDRIALFTPRPGRIREIVPVPFERPRPPRTNAYREFGELEEYLWDQLRAMQPSPHGRGAAQTSP